jgi:hypothetical protein
MRGREREGEKEEGERERPDQPYQTVLYYYLFYGEFQPIYFDNIQRILPFHQGFSCFIN